MPELPYREFPPMFESIGHHHLATGLVLATAVIPDEPAVERFAGMPGFLFLFSFDHRPHVPMLYIPKDDEEAEGLGRLITPAIDTLKKYRKGRTTPKAIHCPGCGVRLHGAVAKRGGCTACFPDLPPGDATAVGE